MFTASSPSISTVSFSLPTESDEPFLKSIVPQEDLLRRVLQRAGGVDLALGAPTEVVHDEVHVDRLAALAEIADVGLKAAAVRGRSMSVSA